MPTARSTSPAASAASVCAPLGGLVATGQQRDAQPGGLGERPHALEMLAREDFGRRHQRRLPARFDDIGHRQQRDDRLARADVALQQPQHALGRGEIGADFGERARLRAGQREGQRGLDPGGQPPVAGAWPAGEVAHARAHHQQRQLIGEQFVIGEPRRAGPTGSISPGSRGLWSLASAAANEGAFRRRAVPSAIHSGKRGNRASAALHGFGEDARKQPLGQSVDRLDGGHFGERFGVHHTVGMDHLQAPVPHFELARHPARGAQRQHLANPVVVGEEEHQFDIAGVVLDQHLVGRLRAGVRRRPMLGDAHFQGCDGVALGVADFRPGAPVERRVGQVVENIDDPRAGRAIEQPVEHLGDLRADARAA